MKAINSDRILMTDHVKRSSLLIFLVFSLIFAYGIAGYTANGADLVVTDLEVSPTRPNPGDEVEISARVLNQGPTDTRRFYVRLYVDGESFDYKAVSFGLDSGEAETVTFSWTARPGEPELRVTADDPFDRIDESNENNNSLSRVISVTERAQGDAGDKLKIAVVSFKDKSNSGFANVSDGVADMLVEKLVNSGFRVLERQKIESVLFEQKLNPSSNSELARASRVVGADALIVGSVTGIDVNETKLDLGFLSVTGATVRVNMSYRVISSYTSEILSADSITTEAEGQTDASFRIGTFLQNVSQVSTNVCAGGFRTNKSAYAPGEVIRVGYLDNNPPTNYTIQFFNSSNPIGPTLFSNFKSTSYSSNCVTWNWNPSSSLPPGNYSVKLYTWPPTNVLASRSFSVSMGATSPNWVGEITFGTKQFSDSVVGDAVEKALSRISSELSYTLNNSSATLLNQRSQYSGEAEADADEDEVESDGLKCRVVSVEGENTVILAGVDGNCGQDEGIKVDDIFYLYPAESVQDPNTGELLEIIPRSDEPKGKVIILDVFNKLSRAQIIGNYPVNTGDLAIAK